MISCIYDPEACFSVSKFEVMTVFSYVLVSNIKKVNKTQNMWNLCNDSIVITLWRDIESKSKTSILKQSMIKQNHSFV